MTWVNSGTLIATKPDSLPGYDTSGKVKVLDYGIENGNIDDGYGYSASTPAANMDPNSTLIVQGMGKDLGSGNTIGEGWDAGEIDGLLSQSSSIFETNTNFGIQAAANTEFDFSNHAIDITGVNVGIVKNSNK